MIAFAFMLTEAAKKAGMSVPENIDEDNLDAFKYTHQHFWMFCVLQLGRRMVPGEHWENATVIAKIPNDRIKSMTVADFRAAGVQGIPSVTND